MTHIFSHDSPANAWTATATDEEMFAGNSEHPSEEEDVFALPASFSQTRLWFLEQWEPGVYNITQSVGLNGQLNIPVMERALREIIRRHEALRTSFKMVENSLLQVVLPQIPFALSTIDLRLFPEDVRKMKARRLIKEEMHRPFDLLSPPLLRATILQVKEQDYILMLSMHHIISDAWSLEVLFYELRELYTAYIYGKPSPLPELELQYADYAIWQREWLQGEVLEKQLNYWREQLADLTVLQLPLDHPRPAVQTFRGAVKDMTIPSHLTAGLNALSRRTGVTLFMTLLAAFNTLLYRYSEQTNIVIGSPIAGRTESKLEQLIGCFINTLVLRTDLSGNPTFVELLGRIREVALNAFDQQDIPFEKLVETLQPDRDLSHNPLTQVMFALQNVPQGEASLPGVVLIPLHNIEQFMFRSVGSEQQVATQHRPMDENKTAMFDLDMTVWEKAGALFVETKYNTDLFEPATIDRIQQHFIALLEAIVANPAQHIADVSFLSSEEQQQVLVKWNSTQREYPREQCYVELFAAQVKRTPHAIAVEYEGECLTYQELDMRATLLAQRLHVHGVGPEKLVALLDERGPQLLVAILAVFKVGAAYLPLDPHHPPTRSGQIMRQSGCHFVITRNTFVSTLAAIQSELPPAQHLHTFITDTLDAYQEDKQVVELDTTVPMTHSTPQALAYVIYTSGSTGVPKGAMVEQRGMLNHIYAKIDALHLSESDSVAQTASQCFDISVWQFLAILLVGGRVRIYPDAIACDPVHLLRSVEENRVSILETVPSLLRVLLDEQENAQVNRPGLQALRWLIPTGEALSVDLCQRWLSQYPHIPLLNAYGPTECSDDVAHYAIERPLDARVSVVPIGSPVPNMQLYVLDSRLRPRPIGVAGEIYAGGVGVGRGYLGKPARTAETFIPDPFGAEVGGRLYKTGDLGRYLPDGNLEFLGRVDHQVKLRGNRIEPGEIEKVLSQHPAIQSCVVIVREDTPGNQRLVAYVVLRQATVTGDTLQHALREALPEYMIPSTFVTLDAMPLTSNGKLDRRALPVPNETRETLVEAHYVAPRNTIEQQLVAIWSEVLGVAQIGVHDDFFALGGHSLLTVRLMKQIEQHFGKRIPLAAIFQGRTIEALAEMLHDTGETSPWSSMAEMHVPPVDLLAEAQLELDVCPEVWSVDRRTEPAHILLTGATGFLGSFLLAELLQQTSASIYCLVRARNVEEGQQKIRVALETSLLWRPEFSSRIKPLVGDLAQPLLGLTVGEFTALTDTLDVIYHNGASVNFMYPYHELKATNVQGTKEVLRLASHGKIKPVHYISTLSVFPHRGLTPIQHVKEQEPLDEYHEHMHDGYAQSKWVAEKLVSVARSRGLPVVIYRPGRITGDSKTGAWNAKDVLSQMIRGCVQLGSSPTFAQEDTLEMTPVNYVSRAIVALSRRRASLGQAFHLLNPVTVSVNDVITWINDFGYRVEKLEYSAWLQALEQTTAGATDNALAPFVSLFPDANQEQQDKKQVRQVVHEQRHTLAGLKAAAITCPPANAELVHTYLTYMVQTGALSAPQNLVHAE